ncbi:PIN domain-containing protein [Microvirga calopogonii]|uniref:PIN domain-containing protein n=1 Tax=Microvirga calopogonii TaxID=2078013 RepID=UPI0013B36E76|nr:PIN domain-containing protein [Microvirga calopogonii]
MKRDIGAVSIDTSVFDHYQTNLDFKLLRSLVQFRGTGVKFLLSEVVVGEVHAHLARRSADSKSKLQAALNQFAKAWKLDSGVVTAGWKGVTPEHEPLAFAKMQVDAFISYVGAEVIKAEDYVSLSDVLARYFSNVAPFSDSDRKKSEFPDAFALSSLDEWGRRNNKKVIIVSRDTDWERFSGESEWLVYIKDLPACLGYFNEDETFYVTGIWKALTEGRAPSLMAGIREAVREYIENVDFHVDADSPFSFEATAGSARFLGLMIKAEGRSPWIIESDDSSISFIVPVSTRFEVAAEFEFSMRDGIDRDYVSLGSSSYSMKMAEDLPVIITVDRTGKHEPTLLDVDLEIPFPKVDFGLIEPNFED